MTLTTSDWGGLRQTLMMQTPPILITMIKTRAMVSNNWSMDPKRRETKALAAMKPYQSPTLSSSGGESWTRRQLLTPSSISPEGDHALGAAGAREWSSASASSIQASDNPIQHPTSSSARPQRAATTHQHKSRGTTSSTRHKRSRIESIPPSRITRATPSGCAKNPHRLALLSLKTVYVMPNTTLGTR